ncbi:hypothetical protein MSG28_011246 [Choristoneura fumiferana]|uniref:Uncharacterized protein n=1 Tax=Choristoneura fumiferana TaxID=7141 RepID=A0ACC0KRY5_CHOFU|nr:hypothetical protein MSG28_011246 [Choristoneura fumiferana]
MGQVSGVALNNAGQVLVFHRASNTWDAGTFSNRNVYQAIGEPPIPHPTVLVFNDTGELVFKFAPGQREQPALVLGEKFVPGNDELHFCKPSAVAVLASGEFFVADGYCNTRIMKNTTVPVKPTTTVDKTAMAPSPWEAWRGAAGGAAGAAGAALLAVAAIALLKARNREFKLRRLLERRRFTRVHSDDSDDEPAPMLPPQPPAHA